MTPDKKVEEIRREVVDALAKLEDMSVEPPKPEPYRRGLSPDSKRGNVTEFTKPTQKLCIELDRLKVPYLGEKYVPVDKHVCWGGNGRCREVAYTHSPHIIPSRCANGHEGPWERVQLKCDTIVEVPRRAKEADQFGGQKISIEAEGSAHKLGEDQSERDLLLKEQGILTLHTPNEILTKHAYWVAELFALLVK